MAIALSRLGVDHFFSGTSSGTLQSLTPADNSLLVMVVQPYKTAVSSITGWGLTWTKKAENTAPAGTTPYQSLWYAQCGSGMSAAQAVVNLSANAGSAWGTTLLQVTGHNTSNPIPQAVTGAGTANPATVALGAPADSNSRPFFVFDTNASTTTFTAGTGYTVAYTDSPNFAEYVLWNSTAWDANPTANNPSLNSWTAIAFEVGGQLSIKSLASLGVG